MWSSRARAGSCAAVTSFAVATALVAVSPAVARAERHTARGNGGAAATVDGDATRAAIDTLNKGGNAVDATVAAAGVLGVTEPFSCGIGGGGFMVIRTRDGKVTTIDSREKAPASMRPDAFFEGGKPLDFDTARFSGLSAGVPGTVRGWDKALRRYGRWSLGRALGPGTRVARKGFKVDGTFASQTEPNVDLFNDVPSTAELYLDPDGTPRDVGSRLRNPDLAHTYERIARRGPSGFYAGPVAAATVKAAQRPPVASNANHTWRPGLMTHADLESYTAPERKPTHVRYEGLDVYGMGPPSSGGSTIGEALNILDGYGSLGGDRTRALHLFLESSRLAFADRGAYLADPAFFRVPLAGLLSDSFAAERRALIDPGRAAAPTVGPGNPYDDQSGRGKAGVHAADDQQPGQSTTHLVVSDRWGNVVSYTFTVESTGGNGIVVPGYGFLLNNELTDFNIDSTTQPNRPDGGKRPRSSISPTLVLRRGKPFLAVGSPGGATIITTVLQVMLGRLDLGYTLPQAIAAPRASERNSQTTEAEEAFIDSAEGQTLAAGYGHAFTPTKSKEIGAVTAIEFGRGTHVLAAAEPVRRGGGSAAVQRP